MSTPGQGDFDIDPEMKAAARRFVQTGAQFKLPPETIRSLTYLTSMPPALDAVRDSIMKQLGPTLASFNQFGQYQANVPGPQLARVAATMSNLDFGTRQLATSPGMKALAESMRSYRAFDYGISAQMSETVAAINTAGFAISQQADILASMRPVMEQLNASLVSTYKITHAFTVANSSALFGASQALASLNESLKLKQSLITSDMARAIFASSEALRSIDAQTLSKIHLAADYAERVDAILSEDEAVATVAAEVEKRFIDRFKMSRRSAQKAVRALIWMTMFSAIMVGIFAGPHLVAQVISSVLSATGALNADNVSKYVAKKLVPDEKEPPQS
ncbi:hypothetical protein GII30_00630 [Gordonia amarae]|nr:hypothetical protein [Gordonia amarae]MCS3876844.1 hypothetical protein [Gordonia amarae]QHN15682.1 hypothetical protein GII35_00630 [Gordonia amarae]QHN20251.1 hypothetical protein GII34_00630 [Gordonia amarae]QHN29102.1 hypothetical protein GII32_00630 [Gordonia amarae]QHN37882.1 hypothetical protein GII30_00630 [Gordonia amarae]